MKLNLCAVALLAAPLLATSLQVHSQPASPSADSCAKLASIIIPASAIGLPNTGATIDTAVLVTADAPKNRDGEYCQVKGFILPVSPGAPKMEFQVNLPSKWNGKAAQFGGGGYDGSLVTGLGPAAMQAATAPDPLQQGYVTLGSDGGHKGGQGFDGTFGLNDEALLNYGKESVKKTHDAAMAVIKARYGAGPKRFYFIGASQGGHEALDAAARYPADYDGVVANYPAYDVTMLHLGSWNVGKALYDNGGAGWLNAAKTKLLTDAVYAACDELDGVKDGIISNVKGCNARFNIATVKATLRCPHGKDTGDTCLSDPQIAAVEKIASPYKPGVTIAGIDEFPRWALLDGALFQGISTFGKRPVPSNPPTDEDALLYNAGAATLKYIITRQPDFDALTFKPTNWKDRLQKAGAIMDVTDRDLTPFRKKGGKIILMHGMIDDLITPHNSIVYYRRLLAKQGKASLDSFMRFYLVPGLNHGFGVFNAKYPGLDSLDQWVETGKAPGRLTAIDANPGSNRSRPMCPYPAWPKYKGLGSPNSADSFTCIAD
ncbi:MAG: tannase/feruloyl esterase family alpha/beta hydrolase [Sphingomonas sp.]